MEGNFSLQETHVTSPYDPMDLDLCTPVDDIIASSKARMNRWQFCDTQLVLVPNGPTIPIVSTLVERLPPLALHFFNVQFSNPSESTRADIDPVSTRFSMALLPNARVVRSVLIHCPPEEQAALGHLVEALHQPSHADLDVYVSAGIRAQGDLLPVMELAWRFGYGDLVRSCRNELGRLMIELTLYHPERGVIPPQIDTAFHIVDIFTQRRFAQDDDGAFESKGMNALRQHPIIRPLVHHLKIVGAPVLSHYGDRLAVLPSIILLHLLICPGATDFALKRSLMARAIRSRIRLLTERKVVARPSPDSMDWDMEILRFGSRTSAEIEAAVLKAWSHLFGPLRRPMHRSRSDETHTPPVLHFSAAPSPTTHQQTASGGMRKRCESSPSMTIKFLEDRTQVAVPVDEIFSTPPERGMDFGADQISASTSPPVSTPLLHLPLSQSQSFFHTPLYSSSSSSSSAASTSTTPYSMSISHSPLAAQTTSTIELCTAFNIGTVYSLATVSVASSSRLGRSSSSSLGVVNAQEHSLALLHSSGLIETANGRPATLTLSMRVTATELTLIASIKQQRNYRGVSANCVVDWDVNPLLIQDNPTPPPPFATPLPTSASVNSTQITFRSDEPVVLSRQLIDTNQLRTLPGLATEPANDTLMQQHPMIACIYIKLIF